MSQNLQKFVKFQKFQLVNLVDFEKCCKTHIFLQKSEPIQPKTSNILFVFGCIGSAFFNGSRRRAGDPQDSQEAGRTTRFVPAAAAQGAERLPLRGRARALRICRIFVETGRVGRVGIGNVSRKLCRKEKSKTHCFFPRNEKN